MNILSEKKIFLMSLLLFFVINVFAQDEAVRQETNKNKKPESIELELIKNKNANAVVVEGVTIDKRVAKYYPEGELEQVSKGKAIKLNYIYLDSYELLNSSAQNNDCELMLKNEFDLGAYNYLRKANERVYVEVNLKGCFFKLALYSWSEIDKIN